MTGFVTTVHFSFLYIPNRTHSYMYVGTLLGPVDGCEPSQERRLTYWGNKFARTTRRKSSAAGEAREYLRRCTRRADYSSLWVLDWSSTSSTISAAHPSRPPLCWGRKESSASVLDLDYQPLNWITIVQCPDLWTVSEVKLRKWEIDKSSNKNWTFRSKCARILSNASLIPVE